MVTPRRRTLHRGASILSALVFVAILSGVITGLEYFATSSTNPTTQVAEVVTAVTSKPAVAKKPDASLKGDDRCNAPIVQKKGPKEGREGVGSVCVKGCMYKIYPGTTTTVDATDTCKGITDAAAKKKCETQSPCNVFQCSAGAGACVAVGGGSDAKKDELLGKAAQVPEYFKDDPTIKKILDDAKTNPAAAQAALSKLDPYMQAAFDEARADEQMKINDKQVDNNEIIKRLGENDLEAKKLADENKRLDEQKANLSKVDTEKLAKEQTPLAPPDKKPEYQGPCQNGVMNPQTGACPPAKQPTAPGCTGPNCSTFADPNAGKNPLGSGSGALDSLLKGLSNAFKPTAPPPPPAAPAQACSTDQNVYAQQQAQYQQQLQQYNYQLQQAQYQQQMNQYYAERNGGIAPPTQPLPAQPTPCTPSTGNQCQSQPQQPAPSACAAGAWRATYNGACITGWQCISTEGPKASLSCEPQTADVGQTLAITYGCSSGIASSSSFKVTTQPGGSATTTVANPPAGTNTATYTLACTDNGKTTGAQCSVQVSRVNIILVANPKTVPAGDTSLLSWLTTGMQSCIISSPDQADFTARNSSNTSVVGAATTSAITTATRFLLHCETAAGAIRDATTTISVSQ